VQLLVRSLCGNPYRRKRADPRSGRMTLPDSATILSSACSTTPRDRSAQAWQPRRQLQRHGGCSDCPTQRTACRGQADAPALGPTPAAENPGLSPYDDSAAGRKRRGHRGGAAVRGVAACPGSAGKSSVGNAVDGAVASYAHDVGLAATARAHRNTPPDVGWWDPSAWHRRPRCARFFRQLPVGTGAERAIGLPTQASLDKEATDCGWVDLFQARFAAQTPRE
jgi:hypothetical protein